MQYRIVEDHIGIRLVDTDGDFYVCESREQAEQMRLNMGEPDDPYGDDYIPRPEREYLIGSIERY